MIAAGRELAEDNRERGTTDIVVHRGKDGARDADRDEAGREPQDRPAATRAGRGQVSRRRALRTVNGHDISDFGSS